MSALPVPSWEELEQLVQEADARIAEKRVAEETPAETFSAVVPDLPLDDPEEERRAALRRALGGLAPEWAVEMAVINGMVAFKGEVGALLLDAVTTAIFTDRGPVMRRLAAYLLSKGVDRFVALALLHGWATHFCAPVPLEDEVVGSFEKAWRDVRCRA